MADDRDFTSYVAARWTRLVRCLVGLGAPLDRAHRLAEQALSSCHDDWDSRDEWADVDVHVMGELLDLWDRDQARWWDDPVRPSDAEALTEAGWPELEAELDRMTVPDRRALVLATEVGLSTEQVHELTDVDDRQPDAAVAGRLVDVLELVPVRPARVEAMVAASEMRSRRRRIASLAGAVALLAIAAVATATVLRQLETSGPERGETFDRVRSLPYYNPAPLAWYGRGTLYLPRAQIPLRDVRAFAEYDEGAVYLDVRGNLVTITTDGVRERIATPGPSGTFAVSDRWDTVAWVEPEASQLVLYDLDSGERRVEHPLSEDGARIVSVEGQRALLTVADEALAVDLTDGSLEPTVDRRLPGELDRYGRYALTQEAGGGPAARLRLIDTSTSRLLPLPVPVVEARALSDARFGPDGSVVLLFEPPGAGFSEVRRCAAPYDDCQLVAYYPSGGARSLLAQ
jgi:hypothetical protein